MCLLFGYFVERGGGCLEIFSEVLWLSGVSSFSVILLKGRRSPESFSGVLLLSGVFSFVSIRGEGGRGKRFQFFI